MRQTLPLLVAGILFSFVGLIHLLRILYEWEITVSGQQIPMNVSVIGFVVTAALALWMFWAAYRS